MSEMLLTNQYKCHTPFSLRRCYVCNPHPAYKPTKETSNKPAIIKAIVKAAKEACPSRHEAWYTTVSVKKNGDIRNFIKRLNEHRARAIDALIVAMGDRLNIISGKVEASVEQLADWCGLSTESECGNKSITRCSKAIITLEELGVIICERVWDKTTGTYIPKMIWVTELFFTLINYDFGRFQAAQNQQLAWINQGLLKKNESPITLTEFRRRAKEKHIKYAFERRAKKCAFKREQKQAKKLLKLEKQQACTEILHDMIKMYSQSELQAMGHRKLKQLVEQRYYTLRKLAARDPPIS
ncbi:plasmid replication initiator RepA [Arsenophonus nasoniae]|uniref:Plasmid replication initiator RepA n=1 Tax=Arsenophonus nasoniae TaxID=638 RepID=A0AA95GBI9_9GAMM|nr:plasmid replication initiator RepA [Arsenophonus nasoniae]WGL94085.1 plasmid replication initiator RepA [Arsenophonus nasoniae]